MANDEIADWLEGVVKRDQTAATTPATRAEIITALRDAGIHASRLPNIVGGKAPTAWDKAHRYIDTLLNQLARART